MGFGVVVVVVGSGGREERGRRGGCDGMCDGV